MVAVNCTVLITVDFVDQDHCAPKVLRIAKRVETAATFAF